MAPETQTELLVYYAQQGVITDPGGYGGLLSALGRRHADSGRCERIWCAI